MGFIHGNKTLVIHKGKQTHDELAIHTVGDPAVSRDGFAKVFDFECPFETRGEEAAKGGDEGGESGKDEYVHLHRGNGDGGCGEGNGVQGGDEDRVGNAGKAGKDVGAEVLLRAWDVRCVIGGGGL